MGRSRYVAQPWKRNSHGAFDAALVELAVSRAARLLQAVVVRNLNTFSPQFADLAHFVVVVRL
jgi:hypothetical protein